MGVSPASSASWKKRHGTSQLREEAARILDREKCGLEKTRGTLRLPLDLVPDAVGKFWYRPLRTENAVTVNEKPSLETLDVNEWNGESCCFYTSKGKPILFLTGPRSQR